LLDIQHSQKTAYPQSNRMVERFHRHLKDALRARCTAAIWVDHLPWVLLGLRAAARENDGTTPGSVLLTTHFTWPFLDLPELPSEILLSNFLRH
jgi:hypothetical protein